MIYTPRTTCSMGGYTDSAFLTEVKAIQLCLSQPAYAMVQPSPAEMQPLIDQMEVYLKEVRERNFKSVFDRNQLRKTMTAMLKLQSTSVNGLANGNYMFMKESGFPMNKEPQPQQVPAKGQLRRVSPMQDGTAIVFFYAIKTRDFYEALVTGANGFSKLITGVNPKMKIPDLPTGVRLDVKVRGVNGKGVGEWSTKMTFSLAPATDESNSNVN